MIELSPVGCDHVGSYRQVYLVLELSHDLTAAESGLWTTRILDICKNAFHRLAQLNGLCQAPCAVRVNVDTSVRECFFQCADCFHLLRALQHTAL